MTQSLAQRADCIGEGIVVGFCLCPVDGFIDIVLGEPYDAA